MELTLVEPGIAAEIKLLSSLSVNITCGDCKLQPINSYYLFDKPFNASSVRLPANATLNGSGIW